MSSNQKHHGGHHKSHKKHNTEKKKDFDLEIVLQGFRQCLYEDGTIHLEQYLHAFTELCRFFKLTGRLFHFVAKDLDEKISMIQRRMSNKEYGEKYVTVQGMLEYEISRKITHHKGHHWSGSRTLLRLHWAMEFIITFMSELVRSSDDTDVSDVASDVYTRTLSKHHPWPVRKVARLAMHMLPNRRQMIEIMCKHDPDTVLVITGQVAEAGTMVYDRIQTLYSDNKLLDIP